ncbi:MAG: glycosyltransferase family 4 protein [Chloroflexota bacterium]|nr:MAG: glycosyl transferase [Chloroflexota bacterium]
MKLAILGPISWRTPPHHYGAWETVVTNLTEGLASRGYDVTLFASSDSRTAGRLEAVAPRPYSEDETLDPKVWEALHISSVMERAAEFDLIHSNFDFLPLTYSRLVDTPMLTTVHGFSIDQFRLVYRKYRDSFFVSISDADRDPYLRYVATVYNGLRLDEFTFNSSPDDYLAFVGRIHPDKGVHLAIEVALRAGRRLLIAGIIQDQEYFDACIKPCLNDRLEFIGPVGPHERDLLFGNAAASLHLTTIPERFGLAMAESMAVGTPVVGIDLGSVREVVADGETGFVVDDVDGAVAAIERIAGIDRRACRVRVESMFSAEVMVDGYLAAYSKVLGEDIRLPQQHEVRNSSV